MIYSDVFSILPALTMKPRCLLHPCFVIWISMIIYVKICYRSCHLQCPLPANFLPVTTTWKFIDDIAWRLSDVSCNGLAGGDSANGVGMESFGAMALLFFPKQCGTLRGSYGRGEAS